MASTRIIVGDKEQIFDSAFLVGDDQDVQLQVASMPVFFSASVRFTAPNDPSPSGTWTLDGGVARFVFRGWSNSIGLIMEIPERFGEFAQQQLYYQMSHRRIGKVNDVHFYVLMDAARK